MKISILNNTLIDQRPDIVKKVDVDKSYFDSLTKEQQEAELNTIREYSKKIPTLISRAKAVFCSVKNDKDTINNTFATMEMKAKKYGVTIKAPHPSQLRNFSPKEQADRNDLQQKYQDKIVEATIQQEANSFFAKTMLSKHCERSTLGFMQEIGENSQEKTLQNINILKNGTPEEKKAFVESKLRRTLAVANKLADKIPTDRDVVEAAMSDFTAFGVMGEMEPLKLKDLEKDFGIEIDPALKAEITDRTYELVGYSGLQPSLELVATGEYSMYDAKDVNLFSQALSKATGDLSVALYDEYETALIPPEDTIAIGRQLDGTEEIKTSSTTAQYMDSYKFGLSMREGIIKTYMKRHDFPEDTMFTDLSGKEVPREEALQQIADGSILDAKDASGNFIKRFSEYSNLSYSMTKEENYNILPNPMNEKALKESINQLIGDVNNTTHWYMSSSKEYKEFRGALKDLANGPLNNEKFLQEKLAEVAKKADAYVASKTDPNVKITSNTEPRINAANKVSLTMQTTLARFKEMTMERDRKQNEPEVSQKQDSVRQPLRPEEMKALEETFKPNVSSKSNIPAKAMAKEKTLSEISNDGLQKS